MFRSLMASMVALALAAGTAEAQQQPPKQKGLKVSVGTATLFNPLFEGDDEFQLSVLPNIRVTYDDVFFASVQEGLGFRLINQGGWQAGPIIRLAFGRQEDAGTGPFRVIGDDPTDLIGLGDVDATGELGGFVRYRFGSWTAGVEARNGIVGGHSGLLGDLTLDYTKIVRRQGAPLILTAGPRARLASDNFVNTFFGIDAEQSVASGLDEFDAGGGLYSVGAGLNAILPFRSGWTVGGFAGYDRLLGDAADSPLVSERGSPNQVSVGLFLTYDFNF